MKTRLYIFLIGLLMAASFTSYGQEIVGEFTFPSINYTNDILTASDGSVIIGSHNSGNNDYMVYKLSPEGTLIDSLALHDAAYGYIEFMGIPSMPDHYIFVSNSFYPYYVSFRFILVDANLTVINDAITDMQTAYSYGGFTHFFVTPDSNIVTQYSKDEGNGLVGHFAFFTLDGTLVKDIPTSEIPSNVGIDMPANDTLLTNRFLSVFSETPFSYSYLGRYTLNGTTHFVNYIMDCDFNLINRIEYAPAAPDMPFANNTNARILPFHQTETTTHLLLAYTSSNPILIKYDNEGTPIAFHEFPTNVFVRAAILKDQNIIYASYGYSEFGDSQHVIRLNEDLERVWETTLPCSNYYKHTIESMEVLPNDDIVIGASLYNDYANRIVQVFIIRDNVPTGMSETIATGKTFTLYPNPVKDRLTLRFDDGTEPESVELYDLAGRLVGTKSNGLENIDMSAMPSGVYLLRVTMKDGTSHHEKILKY